jgi:hypothetical protein
VGLPGLSLADALPLGAANAPTGQPDVVARFASGRDFGDHVGQVVSLEIELQGGARAYSVAWA